PCVVPDGDLDLVVGGCLGDRVGICGRGEVAGAGVDPVARHTHRGGNGLAALDRGFTGFGPGAVGQDYHGVHGLIVGRRLVAVEAVAAEDDALGDRLYSVVVLGRESDRDGVRVG